MEEKSKESKGQELSFIKKKRRPIFIQIGAGLMLSCYLEHKY